MANEGRVDPMAPKIFFLERKDAKEMIDHAPQHPQSSLAPGPYLRSDVIENRHSLFSQLSGQAQVEIRRIGENSHGRTLVPSGASQEFEDSENARDMADDFEDPDHSDLFALDNRSDAACPQPFAGAAEELGVGKSLAKGFNQLGAVAVSRRFAG